MYIHVLLFYNICLLTYSHIKIFVDVNEAENVSHVFISIVFLLSLIMLVVFLVSILYYAWNMLELVEST